MLKLNNKTNKLVHQFLKSLEYNQRKRKSCQKPVTFINGTLFHKCENSNCKGNVNLNEIDIKKKLVEQKGRSAYSKIPFGPFFQPSINAIYPNKDHNIFNVNITSIQENSLQFDQTPKEFSEIRNDIIGFDPKSCDLNEEFLVEHKVLAQKFSGTISSFQSLVIEKKIHQIFKIIKFENMQLEYSFKDLIYCICVKSSTNIDYLDIPFDDKIYSEKLKFLQENKAVSTKNEKDFKAIWIYHDQVNNRLIIDELIDKYEHFSIQKKRCCYSGRKPRKDYSNSVDRVNRLRAYMKNNCRALDYKLNSGIGFVAKYDSAGNQLSLKELKKLFITINENYDFKLDFNEDYEKRNDEMNSLGEDLNDYDDIDIEDEDEINRSNININNNNNEISNIEDWEMENITEIFQPYKCKYSDCIVRCRKPSQVEPHINKVHLGVSAFYCDYEECIKVIFFLFSIF